MNFLQDASNAFGIDTSIAQMVASDEGSIGKLADQAVGQADQNTDGWFGKFVDSFLGGFQKDGSQKGGEMYFGKG